MDTNVTNLENELKALQNKSIKLFAKSDLHSKIKEKIPMGASLNVKLAGLDPLEQAGYIRAIIDFNTIMSDVLVSEIINEARE